MRSWLRFTISLSHEGGWVVMRRAVCERCGVSGVIGYMKFSEYRVRASDNPKPLQYHHVSYLPQITECWMIQAWGLPYCRECEYLATEECGGYRIRKLILQGKYPKDGLPDVSQKHYSDIDI